MSKPQDTDADPAPVNIAAFFIGAIVIGSILGLFAPETGALISNGQDTTLLIMISLLFFEVSLGTVYKSLSNLRFIALAWSANFIIIPLIGLTIASFILSHEPLLLTGLMIYFLAPCTDWFLGFTKMACGDTALGLALIPVNMISQLLLFPFWLWLLTKQMGQMDVTAIPGILTQWFLLPFLTAQLLRFGAEKFLSSELFERLLGWIGKLTALMLIVLIIQIFAVNIGVIASRAEVFALIAIAVLLFFAATYLVAEVLARFGGLAYPQRALLGMTMTARNAPLMLALTAAALPDQPLVLAAIVVGMLVEIPLLMLLKEILLRRQTT
jgi:ACR3 family arsenite efflux pump ArsB